MRPPKGTLLDTHVLLWTLAGSSELGSRFRNLLGSHGPVFFSAISLVELAIKASVKKLPQDQLTPQNLVSFGLRELPFDAGAAGHVNRFPALQHHDPFDRMLVAQAVHHSLFFETADKKLLDIGLRDLHDPRV